jgi:hypothetical protein
VVLAGDEAPPNFGKDYTLEFRRVYADVAKYNATLPFLLDRVAETRRSTSATGSIRRPKARRGGNVWSVLSRSRRTPLALIALRGLEDGGGTGPLTILHPLTTEIPAASCRGCQTVGKRKVDAARVDRRPRRADIGVRGDRRRRHHEAG